MNYIITDTQLTNIADAIRAKTGKVDTITVDEMPDEISGISGGGSSELKGKSVILYNGIIGVTGKIQLLEEVDN